MADDKDAVDENNKKRRNLTRRSFDALRDSFNRYPRGVYYMLGNEFCERFSFYGMRAILMLYLINEHHFSPSGASLIFHSFVSICYLAPLFGSVMADNFFGRFKVILWVSIVYVLGHGLLSLGAIPGLDTMLRNILDFGGLFTIAVATGGIKPCVSAFAADQFPPEMTHEREQFFSFFYFAINAGSLLAIMITPILRGRVKCLGSDYCFPLAFGVPGVLMLLALLLFLAGWRTYKRVPVAKGNIVWQVCKCIFYGLFRRIRLGPSGGHWMDYAMNKYDPQLVEGVKSMLSVITLFLPVVLFWALFDQLGSTWILQARRMNGRVGNVIILPDQMNIFNPLFILILVPIFEGVIYPLLRKMRLPLTALKKMGTGGLFAALSFVVAGLLQLKVNESLVPQPNPGTSNIAIISDSNCHLNVTRRDDFTFTIHKGYTTFSHINSGNYQVDSVSPNCYTNHSLNLTLPDRGYVVSFFQSSGQFVNMVSREYELEKTDNGKTRLYVLADTDISWNSSLVLVYDHKTQPQTSIPVSRLGVDSQNTKSFLDIQPAIISSGLYSIYVGSSCQSKVDNTYECMEYKLVDSTFEAGMGAAHVLVLSTNFTIHPLISANTISLMWQLPQFFIITIGEVLFSVTGLEFSYSQASPNMKSVLQALWLLTVSFGNFIDMAISGSHVVPEPATEFFVYAALMAIVMLAFILLAHNYTYVNPDKWSKPASNTQSFDEIPNERSSEN